MKNREENRRMFGSLAGLVLFALFAVCVLAVLLIGTEVYRKLTVRNQQVYEKRTAIQYLTTKLRQADVAGGILVEDFDGQEALVISEEVEGTRYRTWIYYYDGYIRELFAAESSSLTADAGEKVLESGDMEVSDDGERFHVEITAEDGSISELLLYPRSGKEVSQ